MGIPMGIAMARLPQSRGPRQAPRRVFGLRLGRSLRRTPARRLRGDLGTSRVGRMQWTGAGRVAPSSKGEENTQL